MISLFSTLAGHILSILPFIQSKQREKRQLRGSLRGLLRELRANRDRALEARHAVEIRIQAIETFRRNNPKSYGLGGSHRIDFEVSRWHTLQESELFENLSQPDRNLLEKTYRLLRPIQLGPLKIVPSSLNEMSTIVDREMTRVNAICSGLDNAIAMVQRYLNA
jgi:hypothetical protein